MPISSTRSGPSVPSSGPEAWTEFQATPSSSNHRTTTTRASSTPPLAGSNRLWRAIATLGRSRGRDRDVADVDPTVLGGGVGVGPAASEDGEQEVRDEHVRPRAI